MNLQGRTALVTGGAVRVGRAISLALVGADARVIVHYNSSSAEAEQLVSEIRSAGGDASAVRADLTRLDEVERLAEDSSGPFGPVDLLVNNASVFPSAPFGAVDVDTWESTLGVNVRAPFFLTQRIGMVMKERGEGVVINLVDLAGIQAWTGYAAHAVSKAALIHLTKVAARALAPEVRVVAIAPGTVLPPVELTEEEIRSLAERTPLKRNGSPEDIANAVLFLASSDFITGEVLVVDGGRLLK